MFKKDEFKISHSALSYLSPVSVIISLHPFPPLFSQSTFHSTQLVNPFFCCIVHRLCQLLQKEKNISYYYMEESVLLGTKPLVDSIRHFIRDPSGVFSVCHLCECRIVQ